VRGPVQGRLPPRLDRRAHRDPRAVTLVDQALDSRNADKLVKGIAHHVEEGIRERFARAAERKH
jgi:hypothetical protein